MHPYIKKNTDMITAYFMTHEDEINNMLDSLNTAFYRTLNAIYDFKTTCFVKINKKGKVWYHIGDISHDVSAVQFLQSLDTIKKKCSSIHEQSQKELLNKMLDTYEKVVLHHINLCLNPICVYFDTTHDIFDEYCDCFCCAMRYQGYYDAYKENNSYDISPSFEYDCLKYFLYNDYTLYYTKNKNLKHIFVDVVNNAENYDDYQYEFEPSLGEITEEMKSGLRLIPISVPYDVQRVVVGTSYYQSDDDL